MRRKHRPGGGRQREVTVESLGARGDGVVLLARPVDDDDEAQPPEPLYLAQTLPGEQVLARIGGPSPQGLRGEVLELLRPSRPVRTSGLAAAACCSTSPPRPTGSGSEACWSRRCASAASPRPRRWCAR
jgi:hypothetical protein